MYPELHADRLKCLERWGLVRAAFRVDAESYFPFEELPALRQASAELSRGTPLRAVLRRLQAARDGQLALDFAGDGAAAEILSLARETRAVPSADAGVQTAFEDFERAAALDDEDPAQQGEAARLYRRALEADPEAVAALVNLANIHHSRGDHAEAEALYHRAISIDAGVAEAHFNLGNLHYDLDRLELASGCYERALILRPAFADAHFYLAVTLERLGHSDEARPHWRAYRNLAPDGEWAALAGEFCD